MTAEHPMSDNRIAPRSRTYLPARIDIPGLGSRIECTVRDLSDTGARVQLSEAVPLPPDFELHIPKFDRSIRVSLRWRRGDTIGLYFTSEFAKEAAPEHGHRYVEKLELENARLKLLLESIREDPSRARLLLDDAV